MFTEPGFRGGPSSGNSSCCGHKEHTHAVFHLFCSLVTPDKCRLNYILANEAFKTQGGVGCEEFEVGGQNS